MSFEIDYQSYTLAVSAYKILEGFLHCSYGLIVVVMAIWTRYFIFTRADWAEMKVKPYSFTGTIHMPWNIDNSFDIQITLLISIKIKMGSSSFSILIFSFYGSVENFPIYLKLIRRDQTVHLSYIVHYNWIPNWPFTGD